MATVEENHEGSQSTAINPEEHAVTSSQKTKKCLIEKIDRRNQTIPTVKEPLDEQNWNTWRQIVIRLLKIQQVMGYVDGSISCPDHVIYPDDADAWNINDMYAQLIISSNVSALQMIHINQAQTAKQMWDNLKTINEMHGHYTAIGIHRRPE